MTRATDPILPGWMSQIAPYRLAFGKVRSSHLGPRPSFAVGTGLEFRDTRPYAPGDDVRYLDWNAWGRLRQLHVKRFETSGQLTLTLVVDRTPSMDVGGEGANKLTFAQTLASALGAIALQGQDRVRLLRMPWPEGSLPWVYEGRTRLPALIQDCRGLSVEPLDRHTRSLRNQFHVGGRRDLAVVIGDVQETRSWFPFLKFLAGSCAAVVLLHLVAPIERNPPLHGPEVDLRDVEQPYGRAARVRVSRGIRDAYRAELEAHFARVRQYCHRHGIGYLQLDSDTPPATPLWASLRRLGLITTTAG